MRTWSFIAFSFFVSSCSFFIRSVPVEKELNIGQSAVKMKLSLEGNDLMNYLNTKLLTDSSRNLISQLGNYKFSTSIDAKNAEDYRYSPNVYIFYDFDGLQLRYIFSGAGMVQRAELQNEIENYKKYVYLDQITIEPEVYKRSLPYDLSYHFGPLSVEKVIGKHNTFFDSGDHNSRTTFTYPEKGLFIAFANNLSDSCIQYITLSDSVCEMKRYPTIFPKYAGK